MGWSLCYIFQFYLWQGGLGKGGVRAGGSGVAVSLVAKQVRRNGADLMLSMFMYMDVIYEIYLLVAGRARAEFLVAKQVRGNGVSFKSPSLLTTRARRASAREDAQV